MAQSSGSAKRFDPYKNFKFRVKWEGRYVAGLSKMSALTYTLHRCWVSKYQSLPDLDASANAVAIETMKLENEG